MPIDGHKPNAYFTTWSGEGFKIEGETRQCIHCQYVWTYRPGSGDIRGFCTRHNGWLCARPECELQQQRYLREFPGRSCISTYDFNKFRFEKYLKDHNYVVLQSGVIVPNSIINNYGSNNNITTTVSNITGGNDNV